MSVLARISKYTRLVAQSIWPMAFAVALPAHADLLEFCTAARPSESVPQAVYDAQCPGYLASQFQKDATAAQTAAITAQQAQQKAQLDLLTSAQGLVKPPASQVASQGVDLAALGAAAVRKDADMTFAAAKKVGELIGPKLSSNSQAVLLTSTELAAILQVPVDSVTVQKALDKATEDLTKVECPVGTTQESPSLDTLTLGALGAEALLSTIATGASMFQPSLIGSAKTSTVSDPQHIMLAGVVQGLREQSKFLHVHTPAISEENTILVSLGTLRDTINQASARLAGCLKDPADAEDSNDPKTSKKSKDAKDSKQPKDPKNPNSPKNPKDPKDAERQAKIKELNAAVANAKALVAAVIKTDGTKPSLLDLAARRAQLNDSQITYTLVLTRDVSGGGIAAVKPNWFQSTRLLMGAVSGVTYSLSDLDGIPALAGLIQADPWVESCGIDQWTKAFVGC